MGLSHAAARSWSPPAFRSILRGQRLDSATMMYMSCLMMDRGGSSASLSPPGESQLGSLDESADALESLAVTGAPFLGCQGEEADSLESLAVTGAPFPGCQGEAAALCQACQDGVVAQAAQEWWALQQAPLLVAFDVALLSRDGPASWVA